MGSQATIGGVNSTNSTYIVAGRQQLHCFLGGTEHLTPHACRFGSVSRSRVGGSKFCRAGRRARMPVAFHVGPWDCAREPPCSEALAEALSSKIFRCDGLIV